MEVPLETVLSMRSARIVMSPNNGIIVGSGVSRHVEVWKEQKYSHGSRRGSKPRLTVLTRTSSNLLDWSCYEIDAC
jgi:hypothetical protein